jgi:UDP-2-acetamido-3-amino-2,3-dideoxy-glucuronate N-acetyltransferase
MGKGKPGLLKKTFIHKTAIVASNVSIGEGTRIWAFVQIGENVKIGKNCIIGNGAYIDRNVIIGNNVKIHNKALLYNGLIVEDNCFIGPGVCFTNDKFPGYNKTRNLKGVGWHLKKGSSVGANATILPDVEIGEEAIVGAGSVVTKSVPARVAVCGNPASIIRRR